MNNNLRILHLEDDLDDATLIRHLMKAEGLVREMVRVDTEADFIEALNGPSFDLILSDFTLPGFDGTTALRLAREKQPDQPFIFVSGTIAEDLAIESLKQGATDYVFKNRLSRLCPSVRRALQGVEERRESLRAEECMRQSEHKYRKLFESLGDAAFLSDLNTGRILDTNKQGELLLDRTRAEIIGLNQSRLLSKEHFATYWQALSAADALKSTADIESAVIRKNGTVVPVNIRASTLLLYERKLVLGLYSDVTEHKRAEERIHEQARLLDLVPDAIMVRDMDNRIQYWNQGAIRLYGWTAEEAMGRKTTELLGHDTAETEAAGRSLLEKGEWSGELHQVTKNNHEILVHSRWRLVRDEQKNPKSILLVNTDITEKMINRLETQSKEAGSLS
ncbi:MAG: putative sensor protein [Pedosphaera sp.]|nr:putative sensor protein [Pedosphaera sp.]